MRRLILWNLVTLDGFVEGQESWDLAWHNAIWGEELEGLSLWQLHSAGTLLFGRVTYEGMAKYWSNAEGPIAQLMNTIPKVVFSTTLDTLEWHNSCLVKENALEVIAGMKSTPGKDLYIFGSATLASSLIHSDLIDEFRLCVVPVLLGRGNPLFRPMDHDMALRLLEAKPLKSGGVILRYEPLRQVEGEVPTDLRSDARQPMAAHS
jgi:dihydrofolate reductase